MKKLLFVLIVFGCCFVASAQVSVLNNLFSEYKASYKGGYTSLFATLDGQYLTISSKDSYGNTCSIRLDMKNTKMTSAESGTYFKEYTFYFQDDNGLDFINNGKKYLRDSWSITCDSKALKNKTEQAFNSIYASFQSTNSSKSSTSTTVSSSATSSNSRTTTSSSSEKKSYSCKYFSIKYPNTWKTVVVGDPNSSTSNLTDASVTIRVINPGQGQPVRNIAINMDPYVDWSQIKQSDLPLLKAPIKRQYPNAKFVSEPEFVRFASLSGVKMEYTTYLSGYTLRFINYAIHKQNGFTYYITACIEDSKAASQTKEVYDIINTFSIK